MTRPVIAYDVLRLFIGPAFVTPRGIDKVDLALATQIFQAEYSGNVGVLPTPIGVFALTAAEVRHLLVYIRSLWAEEPGAAGYDQLRSLTDRIVHGDGYALPLRRSSRLKLRGQVERMLRMLLDTGFVPRRLAVRAVPADAVYLNVGQLGLAMPGFFRWLAKRPDVTRAMMLHDAIPIDYPHLVGKGAPSHHLQMIRTAAEHSDCVIFNSEYTRASVGAVMRGLGHSCPPALVRPLPLSAAFAHAESGVAALAGTRYFLAISTIEPRKNFGLLLRVWQRLVATMGAGAPHLVIVGAPGRDAEDILMPLRFDPTLAGRVHHAVGLSSPALAALMLGAAGMLCPSLAEGFGLSLLEAGAMGVPAVASDIAAHREVATAATTLVSIDDDEGWARAIAILPGRGLRRRPDIPVAMTESAYCADIVDFVSAVRAKVMRGRSPGRSS